MSDNRKATIRAALLEASAGDAVSYRDDLGATVTAMPLAVPDDALWQFKSLIHASADDIPNERCPAVLAHRAIYDQGGFYDSGYRLADMAGSEQVLFGGDAFLPERQAKRFPVMQHDEAEGGFRTVMDNHANHVMDCFNVLAGSAIVKIRNAWIYNGVILVENRSDDDGEFSVLYETWRAVDRHVIPPSLLARFRQQLAARSYDVREVGSAVFSAGYTNYGHWLVDDLACLIALARDGHPAPFITTAWSEKLNAVKRDSARVALGRSDVDILFQPFDRPVFVKELSYCTPVSYHPPMKSKEALALVRTSALAGFDPGGPGKRIFVSRRPSSGRNVTNSPELMRLLSAYGFTEVFCEDLSFEEQVRTFAEADFVIGIMGAALTNIVFSRRGANVLCLAPTGWDDVFFWDLCESLGFRYAAHYGVSGISHVDPTINFTINVEKIRQFLERKFSMDRHQVVQQCLDLFENPRYLEIGVNQGHTFHAVTAFEKVGVDPQYLFDVEAARATRPENTYIVQTSDDYFKDAFAAKRPKFDVIFVDGLHVFEQVLRDFLNSCSLLSETGIIIVDDVVPADFAASVADLDKMYALRRAQGTADSTWMGDVFKLVFFVSSFVSAFEYNTVEENHGQMICWRGARTIEPRALASVESKDFGDVVLESQVFRFLPFNEILGRVRASRAAG